MIRHQRAVYPSQLCPDGASPQAWIILFMGFLFSPSWLIDRWHEIETWWDAPRAGQCTLVSPHLPEGARGPWDFLVNLGAVSHWSWPWRHGSGSSSPALRHCRFFLTIPTDLVGRSEGSISSSTVEGPPRTKWVSTGLKQKAKEVNFGVRREIRQRADPGRVQT